MPDISDINSAQTVKVVGSDTSGVEQTPVQSTSTGGLHINLRNNSGVEIGVPTTPLISNNAFSTIINTRPVITSTDSTILSSNSNRRYALIVNQSGQTVYLKLGATAITTQGIPLAPGASYTIDASNLFTGEVHAIKAGGSSVTLDVMEGTV